MIYQIYLFIKACINICNYNKIIKLINLLMIKNDTNNYSIKLIHTLIIFNGLAQLWMHIIIINNLIKLLNCLINYARGTHYPGYWTIK